MGAQSSIPIPEPVGYGIVEELAIDSLDSCLVYHCGVHLKIERSSGNYYALAGDGTKLYVYTTRSDGAFRAFLDDGEEDHQRQQKEKKEKKEKKKSLLSVAKTYAGIDRRAQGERKKREKKSE